MDYTPILKHTLLSTLRNIVLEEEKSVETLSFADPAAPEAVLRSVDVVIDTRISDCGLEL